MQDKRYLLNLEQLLAGEESETLFKEALSKVDAERRQKALRMKKDKGQAASLGAGLLLQKALAGRAEGASRKVSADSEAGESRETPADSAGGKPKIQLLSVKELLALIERPVIEPEYGYGRNGKPYFKNYPLKFNLSHSGKYVFCGVSEQEIGVDIQEMRNAKEMSLAKRFFSEGECRALERCGNDEERRRMFFRMWARKEAYGKLTGQGIAGTMKKDLWADDCENEELIWEEYDIPAGYSVAVCKYSTTGRFV